MCGGGVLYLVLLSAVIAVVFMGIVGIFVSRRVKYDRTYYGERQIERPDPRGQLVGRRCIACGRACSTVLDAAWCAHCDDPLHHECEGTHRASAGAPYR